MPREAEPRRLAPTYARRTAPRNEEAQTAIDASAARAAQADSEGRRYRRVQKNPFAVYSEGYGQEIDEDDLRQLRETIL
jgi:hypothetical protein